jgi:hypothetical protein
VSDYRAYIRAHTTVEIVRKCYGDAWHIFPSEEGWTAIRRGGGIFVWAGPQSLIRHCLWSEHLDDLASQLSLQSFLDKLGSDELALVYNSGEIPGDLFLAYVSGDEDSQPEQES